MLRRLASLAALGAALSACISGGARPLPKLAEDPEQPELALLEHVLTGHFAAAGARGPATCAALAPVPLTAEQEGALLDRFVRLAPASRCGENDAVVRVYDFACPSDTVCSGWVARPGVPATRYAMRVEDGAWRFDGDLRIIAE